MKYTETQKQFTDILIPEAWENVVKMEKLAEILVYNVISQCMENFEDVSIDLPVDEPIGAVLKSWARDEQLGFGKNALTLTSKDDGGVILSCVYDICKLREDLEMMSTNLFGTLDPDKVGGKVMEEDIDISDDKINSLVGGIQRKRIIIKKDECKL